MITLNLFQIVNSLCDDLDLTESTREYLNTRLSNEGFRFLTVTLPKLSAAVLRSLDSGYFDRAEITCFRWKGKALANFSELIDPIFDRDGTLRAAPCPIAIYRVRQMCDYLYKLALTTDETAQQHAVRNFLQTEESLGNVALDLDLVDHMRKNIETNYQFGKLEDVYKAYRPRYGPGTFANENRTDEAYYVTKQLNVEVVPSKFHFCTGLFKAYPSAPVPAPHSRGGDTAQFSELLFVPKDSRGPRSIVREPMFTLSYQMMFFDWMTDLIERQSNGRIQFTSQDQNKELARIGSLDGKWSTIDLKDASDRVSLKLVKALCKNIPVLNHFMSYRSEFCKLPNGDIIKLNKLAGMGSGLTFVMLAFVCHTAIATAISRRSQLSFSQASKLVFVYGDDVIVPTCYTQDAYKALEAVGLLVNTKKSFTKLHLGRSQGYFRESCGGDYFGGNDVGVVRLKLSSAGPEIISRTFVDITKDAEGIIQLNAHARELVKAGMCSLAEYFYSVLEIVVGKLPVSNNDSTSAISRYTRKYITYEPDSYGNYPLIRVVMPQSVVEYHDKTCPYIYMSSSLQGCDEDKRVFVNGELSVTPIKLGLHNVVVPRCNKLRRVKLSSFSLERK